jgi:hypothetical protein
LVIDFYGGYFSELVFEWKRKFAMGNVPLTGIA